MPWPVHPTGFFGARGDSDTYRIERSLRFNSDDSAYLIGPLGSDGNRKTWTFSAWVKRGSLGSRQFIMGNASASGTNGFSIEFDAANCINLGNYTTGYTNRLTTNAVFRDVASWYHIVFAHDTTQATNSDRFKLYVNGSLLTSFSTATYPTLDYEGYVNLAVRALTIGRAGEYNSLYFDGYLTEIHFIEGQALTPSSFGETDAITGRWKAKAYSGTYGTKGFYLKFADNSGTTSTTLGKDSSGNGNNHTPNNFSVTAGAGNDSLVDSPTNYGSDTGVGGEVRGNYATLNPISTIKGTIIDGNLRTNGGDRGSISTIGMSSGKWFCEMYVTTVGAESTLGVSQGLNILNTYVGATSDSWGYRSNGPKYNNAISANYGSSYTSGDKIGCAFDADNGILEFYKNGVSQGTAYTGLTSGPYYFATSGRSATSANDVTINFGQQAWAHTPPSGFKALCTQNLTQPTIQKPSKYMDALAYTGTGASNSISSLGFSPDLVWIKNRGTTTDHALYDIVRGAQAQLSSNTTGSEVTSSSGLTAFDSAGFTIGTSSLVNTSGTQYVSWSWDAGSTNSTNTSGSITSTVRANPQAGFSIVSYTGNGTAGATIGHGLGSSPKMMIVKSRSRAGDNWDVYHASIGATGRLYLNLTNATDTSIAPWNNTAPTSSVFSVGTAGDTNANTVTYIAYCFAEIEGYSKIGSYTGNGSSDGPFVWCGFRPRWVLIKTTNQVDVGWIQHDSARNTSNLSASRLRPNTSDAQTSDNGIDILSNGFKMRSADGSTNASGSTFIFAAFAESPFKYARAR
jgi:hypothetical protein